MSILKARNDAELLSYIINIEPTLRENIDLPVQGESIAPIGQIIVNNQRYKNAFINAINVIGLTMIDRNYWEDPWENFTNNGYMSFGDSARELAVDIADVFDYNTYALDVDHFLENVVPNVYEYISDEYHKILCEYFENNDDNKSLEALKTIGLSKDQYKKFQLNLKTMEEINTIAKNINLKIKELSEQIDETQKFWSKRQKFLL